MSSLVRIMSKEDSMSRMCCASCGSRSTGTDFCATCGGIFCIKCQSNCMFLTGRKPQCAACGERTHELCTKCRAPMPMLKACSHCQICFAVVCANCSIVCCNSKYNNNDADVSRYCESCFRAHHICRLCHKHIPLGACISCHICISMNECRRVCSDCSADYCSACGRTCAECYDAYHLQCAECIKMGRRTIGETICAVYIRHDIHKKSNCATCNARSMCTTTYFVCTNKDCGTFDSTDYCSTECSARASNRCDACFYPKISVDSLSTLLR